VSGGLENEPEKLMSMYEIECKSSVDGWEAIRSRLFKVVTESEGMPAGQKCVICGENEGLIKCRQCGPQSFFCQGCAENVHAQITFLHSTEQWMVS